MKYAPLAAAIVAAAALTGCSLASTPSSTSDNTATNVTNVTNGASVLTPAQVVSLIDAGDPSVQTNLCSYVADLSDPAQGESAFANGFDPGVAQIEAQNNVVLPSTSSIYFELVSHC